MKDSFLCERSKYYQLYSFKNIIVPDLTIKTWPVEFIDKIKSDLPAGMIQWLSIDP